ncbi:LANO_0B07580g1_1 [Lachancea nothofagi CBS 11611]|uniref:DASH complex subunit SPC34 n=1 Tax=Lachancea nothofagi CBS 11611 TaxID=1266666 RepID=A0A1G4IZS9_9SACH|nr:LANO_0B07580g1_1 [Lachancea nothofagi CBS 11611]
MSGSLNDCLDQIKQSCDSISTLYFKPPGIFHNAIVPDPSTSYADIITNIIRDGDPQEEASLYKINENKLPRRKDDKVGVFDFLTEHEANLKRSRRLGNVEHTPIIHVPKDFYLKQHEQDALRSRKQQPYLLGGSKTEGILKVLLKNFENDEQVKNLLHALQNGTVITEDETADVPNRRKTLFVEDFPVELIFKVHNEIVTQWPVSEYQKNYSELLQHYTEIDSDIRKLRQQIGDQEAQLQDMNMSSGVARLIQKEQQEVLDLQQKLQKLERSR